MEWCRFDSCFALRRYGFAYEAKCSFSEIQYSFSVICKAVDFSRSFAFHVPLAFDVALFFECVEEGIDCAGSEVDAEAFSDFCYYLITVHWLLFEKLEYYHV